jgi:hypothetical protein
MEKIEFPEKIKQKTIKWYKIGLGSIKISKKLEMEENFAVSPGTIRNRILEWGVKRK